MSEMATYKLYLFDTLPRSYFVGFSPDDRETEAGFSLPLSQVELVDEFHDADGSLMGEFRVPDWLAKEKGLWDDRDDLENNDPDLGDLFESS